MCVCVRVRDNVCVRERERVYENSLSLFVCINQNR